MRRMAYAVVVLAGFCAGSARAETLPILDGIPETYTPGQAFSFDVRVPLLPDFDAYTIELIFSTTVPDPALLASPTPPSPPPTGRYVFSSNANFQFTLDRPPGSTDVSLLFSDSGALTIAQPGINDILARVTVFPDASLTGPITISLGGGTQFDYSTEGPFYASPDSFVVQQAAATGNPVPAPPAVLLLAVGGLLVAARARFQRKPA